MSNRDALSGTADREVQEGRCSQLARSTHTNHPASSSSRRERWASYTFQAPQGAVEYRIGAKKSQTNYSLAPIILITPVITQSSPAITGACIRTYWRCPTALIPRIAYGSPLSRGGNIVTTNGSRISQRTRCGIRSGQLTSHTVGHECVGIKQHVGATVPF